jgi:hypothetical protein
MITSDEWRRSRVQRQITGQQVAIVHRDGSIIKSKLPQLQVFDGWPKKRRQCCRG